MSTWRKYVLLQVPTWVVALAVVWGLNRWVGLPWWAAVALFAGYVAKDFLLYPFLRRAYESGATGAAQLIGATGVAAERLAGKGYVRIRGELWQAEAAPGSPAIPEGARVRVESARGMVLVVRAEPGSPA